MDSELYGKKCWGHTEKAAAASLSCSLLFSYLGELVPWNAAGKLRKDAYEVALRAYADIWKPCESKSLYSTNFFIYN